MRSNQKLAKVNPAKQKRGTAKSAESKSKKAKKINKI